MVCPVQPKMIKIEAVLLEKCEHTTKTGNKMIIGRQRDMILDEYHSIDLFIHTLLCTFDKMKYDVM